MTTPREIYIDINIKTRNLKNLLKKIKPETKENKYVYNLKDRNTLLKLVAIGTQNLIKTRKMKKDRLSGLTYRQIEIIIEHGSRKVFHIYWDGEYYRLKLIKNPFTIKIVVDKINDP